LLSVVVVEEDHKGLIQAVMQSIVQLLKMVLIVLNTIVTILTAQVEVVGMEEEQEEAYIHTEVVVVECMEMEQIAFKPALAVQDSQTEVMVDMEITVVEGLVVVVVPVMVVVVRVVVDILVVVVVHTITRHIGAPVVVVVHTHPLGSRHFP
jgi:hypothetical protein